MSLCVVSLDSLWRWQVQLSVYCARRIPAQLRCTQCSILLQLIDICFITCVSVADIANPDLLVCCCRTWISCCCIPSQTYGRNGVTPILDLLTELPVPPQAAGVVGTFYVFKKYLYHSEHYGIIFGPYGCHIIFTRSPLFVYISIIFGKYTLHVSYVLTLFDGLF